MHRCAKDRATRFHKRQVGRHFIQELFFTRLFPWTKYNAIVTGGDNAQLPVETKSAKDRFLCQKISSTFFFSVERKWLMQLALFFVVQKYLHSGESVLKRKMHLDQFIHLCRHSEMIPSCDMLTVKPSDLQQSLHDKQEDGRHSRLTRRSPFQPSFKSIVKFGRMQRAQEEATWDAS